MAKLKFTLRHEGKNIKEILKEIDHTKKKILNGIDSIGNNAEFFVQDYIDNHRIRTQSPHSDDNAKASKQPLHTAIRKENINAIIGGELIVGWGLGNIDYLEENSPHWAFINYGGTPPSTSQYPKLWGHFDLNQGGLFRKGKPHFPIYPTSYPGMDYIGVTRVYIEQQIDELLKKGKLNV